MERTRRLVRPPQVGDVWYVRMHVEACTPRVDTVQVLEQTEHTVLLCVHAAADTPEFICRFCTADIRWVEFVREMPRAVTEENVSCLMPRLDPMAPPSEQRHRALMTQDDRNPPPLPTPK